MRYLNYFENIKISPLFEYNNIFLSSVIINTAPAIANLKLNDSMYLNIDKNSYYTPYIRIISNNKIVYASNSLENIMYSVDSSKKFDINTNINGDTLIEVYHIDSKLKQGKYKLLFVIQFNTLFLQVDYHPNTKFSKSDIDGIKKDIRYHNLFNVDLFYDPQKIETISSYSEEIVEFKSAVSNFVVNCSKEKKVIKREEKKEKENNEVCDIDHREIQKNNIINHESKSEEEDLDDYLNSLAEKA